MRVFISERDIAESDTQVGQASWLVIPAAAAPVVRSATARRPNRGADPLTNRRLCVVPP